MKKGLFLITVLVLLSSAGFFSATEVGNTIPIQIQALDDSGNVITGTFTFQINISNSIACSPVLYSNTTSKTTDARGIVTYNLENVDLAFDEQYWFCYYRDGTLKQTIKAARVPYTFKAKNVTLSGVSPDVNFDMGSYNITAGNLFGNLLWNYIQSFPYTHLSNFTDNLGSRGYTNLLNFTNGPGFFNNILNFTGTLTNTKYCTYNSTDSKIHCNAEATVSETDPYWTGNQSLYFTKSNTLGFGYYNLTSFDINNYYLATNPFSFYNSTTLPASVETLWNANYSAFLTHITWANAVNGTLLSQATFNTNYSTNLAKLTEVNNFGNFNQTFNGSTLVIDALNQRVGIGTTSPTEKLNVVGNANITGNLTAKAQVFRARMIPGDFLKGPFTWERVPFNSTIFNTLKGTFDAINGRFTASQAGYYQISVTGYSSTPFTTNGDRYAIGVYKNGAVDSFTGGDYTTPDSPLAGYSGIIYLNGVTDYVEIWGFSGIAATWTGEGTVGHEMFWHMNYLGT